LSYAPVLKIKNIIQILISITGQHSTIIALAPVLK